MRFRFTGKLFDKEVKINGKPEQVYGLASLSVRPRGEGFGSELIKSFDKAADNKGKWGVVAFTDERTWPFYAKTGWYRHGIFKSSNYPDRIIVTSKPCENIEVTERW